MTNQPTPAQIAAWRIAREWALTTPPRDAGENVTGTDMLTVAAEYERYLLDANVPDPLAALEDVQPSVAETKLMKGLKTWGSLSIYYTDITRANLVIDLEMRGLVVVNRDNTNGNYMVVSLPEKPSSVPEGTSPADAEFARDYWFGPQNGTPLIPPDTTECRYCSAPHGKAHLPGCERYEPWQDGMQRENDRLMQELENLRNDTPRVVYPALQAAIRNLEDVIERSYQLPGQEGADLIVAATRLLNALADAKLVTRSQF